MLYASARERRDDRIRFACDAKAEKEVSVSGKHPSGCAEKKERPGGRSKTACEYRSRQEAERTFSCSAIKRLLNET